MREKNNRFKSTKVYSFIYLCSEASPILPAYPYEFNTSVLIYHWFRLVAKFERWKEHTNKIHKSNVLLQHLPEIYVCTVKFFLKSIPTIAPATQNNNNSNENNSSYKPKKKKNCLQNLQALWSTTLDGKPKESESKNKTYWTQFSRWQF